MYKPLSYVVKQSAKLTKASVSAQRIAEILDIEPLLQGKPDAIDVNHLSGDIHFEHGSFGYAAAPDILCELSFPIHAGKRVALVVEQGTHGQLLERNGVYAHLYHLQERDSCPISEQENDPVQSQHRYATS
jgi:ATP-binding cassette subfamily B protein/subfamily B ATP-binding cassette protein MsbA